MSLIEQFRYQFKDLPLSLTPEDCQGKTYIVTGANIGLGLECARHLVKLQSERVILAVRSIHRGEEAVADIEAETGRKGVAEVWPLDLSSYESVKQFAFRVETQLNRVDAIIENATAADGNWVVAEGFELSLTVNVLSTLLLAVLLMPYLEVCAKRFNIQPRVCIVTSGLAFEREVDLPKIKGDSVFVDLSDQKKWRMDINRYSLSKLVQVFATRGLAAAAPPSQTGVVISLVNPGLCNTGLTRYAASGTKIAVALLRSVFGRSAEWGSRNYLYGIAAGEESHGKYISSCEVRENWVPNWVSGKEGQQWSARIWDEVAAELEKIQPGCVGKALKTQL